jgi:hypothetical protein
MDVERVQDAEQNSTDRTLPGEGLVSGGVLVLRSLGVPMA